MFTSFSRLSSRHTPRIAFLIAALCGTATAWAEATTEVLNEASALPSPLTIRGFGTLGLARTNTDQAEYVRNLVQPGGVAKKWSPKADTVFGLQANYQLSPQLEAVAQVISTYHAHGTYAPELHWALLRYAPDPYWTFRAGRMGAELYMLSDSRYVGYSQLTLRPQSDYYGGLPFHYVDGADIEARTPYADGILKAKLFGGLAREKIPLGDRIWKLDGSKMLGAYLDYQVDAWQWRLGYAQMTYENNLPLDDLTGNLIAAGATSAANRIAMRDTTSRYYSLGMVYDWQPVRIKVMLNKTDHETDVLENWKSGLILGAYRMKTVTPYLGYSWVKSQAKSADTGLPNVGALATLNSSYSTVLRDSHSDHHTVTMGLRWDLRRNMAFKVQLDAIRGASDSIFLTRSDRPGYNGRMNVIGVGLDFVF